MRAGLLKEVINILSATITVNTYGEEKTTWNNTYTTRARVIHTGGNRSNPNDEIFYEYVKTLQVRHYVPVDEFNRIQWKGKIYRILDIEPDDDQMMQTIKIQLVDD